MISWYLILLYDKIKGFKKWTYLLALNSFIFLLKLNSLTYLLTVNSLNLLLTLNSLTYLLTLNSLTLLLTWFRSPYSWHLNSHTYLLTLIFFSLQHLRSLPFMTYRVEWADLLYGAWDFSSTENDSWQTYLPYQYDRRISPRTRMLRTQVVIDSRRPSGRAETRVAHLPEAPCTRSRRGIAQQSGRSPTQV